MLSVRIVPDEAVRHPADRRATQMLSLLLAAVGVPVTTAVLLHTPGVFERPGTWISAGSAAAASIAALLGFRRVSAFPGTRATACVLPSFCAAYGIMAAALLLLRLDYSGALLLTSFAASTLCGFLLAHLRQRGATSHFYLVPFGANPPVGRAPNHRWAMLHEPRLPLDPRATIVADLRADLPPEWERMLARAAVSGRPVLHAKQLRESLTGKVEIEHLSENSFGSLAPDLLYRRLKRLIDAVLATMALPLLAIPFLVIAVLVRLESPGPAFFLQERIGHRGRPFRLVKFRTMRIATAAYDGMGERTDAITRPGDARVTRLGRLLRRSRLDELPQLVNVLRGEMSLIGPRPEATPLSCWYDESLPFYAYRHVVRPGITGWAQVNQGHVAGLDDVHVKLHYDFFYIKNFSAWLDALIGLKTVATMLTGFGAR